MREVSLPPPPTVVSESLLFFILKISVNDVLDTVLDILKVKSISLCDMGTGVPLFGNKNTNGLMPVWCYLLLPQILFHQPPLHIYHVGLVQFIMGAHSAQALKLILPFWWPPPSTAHISHGCKQQGWWCWVCPLSWKIEWCDSSVVTLLFFYVMLLLLLGNI